MIDTFHRVDELYRLDAVIGGRLRIAIKGTHVMTSASPPSISVGFVNAAALLDNYGMWLAAGATHINNRQESVLAPVRGPGIPTAADSCLNHLFTHSKFTGDSEGTVGVAKLGTGCDDYHWYRCPGGGLTNSNSCNGGR